MANVIVKMTSSKMIFFMMKMIVWFGFVYNERLFPFREINVVHDWHAIGINGNIVIVYNKNKLIYFIT